MHMENSSGVAPRALIRYLHPQVRSRQTRDRSRRLVVRRRLLSATSQTATRACDRRLAARAVLPVAHGKPQRAEPVAMDAQKPDNGARRRRSPRNVGPNLPARQPWRDETGWEAGVI